MKIIIKSENYQQLAKLLEKEPIFFVLTDDDKIEEISQIIYCDEVQFSEVVKSQQEA